MARQISVVFAALLAAACGSSDAPMVPTPPPVAQIQAVSQLTISECVYIPSTNQYTCDYSGLAQNIGQGCAAAVAGVTKTFDQNNHLLSASQWTYARTVRPNEQFVYSAIGSTGTVLVPAGPATWSYDTAFSFNSVACQ